MRYEDIFYARPDVDAVCKALKAMEARVASASCAKEQLDCLKEAEIVISGASTALGLGQLRYFQDTADPKRAQEMDYIGQNAPKLELAIQSLHCALANSPFRGELSAALGAFFFDRADADARLADEALLPLISEEQELVQRYLALTGQAAVTYEGREIPLSAMTPYYAAPDRARRREAMRTVNAWYEQNAQELEALFDGLVRNRTEQAHKLGYQSYTDMKYAQRFGYGRGQVEAFRAQVLEKWVPLVCEVKQRQRARLGVPTFRIYDSALRFADGNPRLLLTGDALVRAAGDVFRQIGEEPGAYFDSLRERHMFDLEDRKGKAAYDGFCIELEDYDADFIFGHFNGDHMDLEVLVHEFGHAFASSIARRNPAIPVALRNGTQDVAETHSKTMELLARPYLAPFFSPEDLRKYLLKQIEYVVGFISSICVGDAFQHEIYDCPQMTPTERNAAYERIYRQYNPFFDYSDLPFSSWGAMWQDTSVIYAMPFYYIDYALAQTQALLFYAESLGRPQEAWARYLRFVGSAGTRSFTETVRYCGLPSPFDDTCFDTLTALCRQQLDELRF